MKNSWLKNLEQRQNALLLSTALILVFAAFVPRLWLLQTRFFDRDEFEHLHTAWLTFEGYLVYRDFFQNHTPLLYFLLAPLFSFFDAARDVGDAVALMFTARRLMWVLAGAILALTYCLGTAWRDWRIGLSACVLLSHTILFLQKTLEIRPDLISVTCWMGCLVLLVRGVQADAASAGRTRGAFAFSGVLLGLSIMATQKMIFAGPGLTLTMLWYLFDRRAHGSFETRLTNVLLQAIGVSIPLLLVLGYFALRNGVEEFIYFNWTLNAGWKIRFSPGRYLWQLVSENGLLVALAVIGVVSITLQMFSREGFRRGDYIIALNGIGLFAGLFLIAVPHRQYFLMFLPLTALYAATAMVDGVDILARPSKDRRPANGGVFLNVNVLFAVISAAIVIWGLPVNPKAPIGLRYMALLTAMGAGWAVIHLAFGLKSTALAILLIISSIAPLKHIRAVFYGLSNHAQIANIRYVLENTSRWETVMDGQEGVGVFRPHAYFYWLLDPNIRLILSDEEKQKLLAALRRGSIAPKLVNLDPALQDLSPEITKFFDENYKSVHVGSIRMRTTDNVP